MSEKILTIKIIYDNHSDMFGLLMQAVESIFINIEEEYGSKNNSQFSYQTELLESEIEKMKNTLIKNKSIFQEGNIGTIGENKCILLKSKFD